MLRKFLKAVTPDTESNTSRAEAGSEDGYYAQSYTGKSAVPESEAGYPGEGSASLYSGATSASKNTDVADEYAIPSSPASGVPSFSPTPQPSNDNRTKSMNSMFAKLDEAPKSSTPERSSANSGAHNSAGQPRKNVLNKDVQVLGDLKFQDDLLIDGRVEGTISSVSSQGTLTIGQSGEVHATINSSTVIVHGKVHGNITAENHLELKSTATLMGDVVARTIAIETGATFLGRSTVGKVDDIESYTPASTEESAAE